MTTEKVPPTETEQAGQSKRAHQLTLFGRSLPLPASRPLRIATGIVLLLGGSLWFLPVLGLWMLPLGLAVLAIDVPHIRRHKRRTTVTLHRRYPGAMRRMFPRPPAPKARQSPDPAAPDDPDRPPGH